MTPQTRLVLASVFLAVFWTLGMIWWTGTDTANIVSLSVAGAVAGVLWFFVMRWWLNRTAARTEG